MKKACVLSLVGIAVSVAQSYAAGYLLFSNFTAPPFNQVIWGFGPLQNQAVRDPAGVQLQLWYGEGIISDPNLLTAGGFATVTPSFFGDYDPGAGHGAGGYFTPMQQVLPTWDPGDTFTFQFRAPAYPGSVTTLWTEQGAIVPVGDSREFATVVPQLVLTPEPSALTLIGTGFAGFFVFRRRSV